MKTLPLKIILLVAALWLPCSAYAAKNLLVFGDSLAAGYGIAVAESWVSLLQQELARSHPDYRVVNASISGETAQGGQQRIAKALQQHHPAVVILELGANDGLRGFNVADTEANLGRIIEASRAAQAKVLLVVMMLPPNYGKTYTLQFEKMYPKLAEKYRVRLVPFLLEGVTQEQFQADNLHPTKEAQPLLMRNVMKELKPLLR
jgi:acyl-CoA thioesterase-1